MRLLQFLEAIRLNELRQRYVDPEADATDNRIVVAHRGNVWILADREVPKAVAQDILQQTGVSDGSDIAGESINVWDLQEMFETRPDIIFGQWNGDDLVLSDRITGAPDPKSSALWRQLAQHLNLNTATRTASTWTGDETEYTTLRHEMKGQLPDVLFHGTNSGVLPSIFRTGLDPNTERSNWPDVGKFNLVFLTTKFEEAAFQANRSADRNRGTEPVVLAVHVPDKAKITWDYDIAARYADPEETPELDTHGYTGSPMFWDQAGYQGGAQAQAANPGTNFMTSTGTVGYNGRIPAKFIEGGFIAEYWGQHEPGVDNEGGSIENQDNWLSASELKDSMDRIEHYGFDPGEDYDPEEDEDEF